MLTFTAAVSMATGVLAGLAPAIQASRFVLVPALKTDTAGAAGVSRAFLRRLLVIGQVALSLLLVIGAALFARSLAKLESLDPGFERDRLVIAFANPESLGYKGQRLHDFFERLREGVERVPGVKSASVSSISPLDGTRWNGDFAVEGYQGQQADERVVDFNSVGARFFETMGIRVLIGREFLPEDSPAVVPDPRERISREPQPERPGPRRAIVNESFASRFLGGGSPLGRRISLTETFDAARAYEVVGVVGDVRYFGLRENPEPMIYVPIWRDTTSSLTLAIRTHGKVAGSVMSLSPSKAHETPTSIDGFFCADAGEAATSISGIARMASTVGLKNVLRMSSAFPICRTNGKPPEDLADPNLSMRKYGNVFAPSGLSAERALPATCPESRTWP